MSWPGFADALPVFPDTRSLERTARELGRAAGTYAEAAMRPRELFAWAATTLGTPVALNAFRAHGPPAYVMISVDGLRDLAEGRVPPRGG